MTVGQVLAKIKAGEAAAQSGSQESASGTPPAESTAIGEEKQRDSGKADQAHWLNPDACAAHCTVITRFLHALLRAG